MRRKKLYSQAKDGPERGTNGTRGKNVPLDNRAPYGSQAEFKVCWAVAVL